VCVSMCAHVCVIVYMFFFNVEWVSSCNCIIHNGRTSRFLRPWGWIFKYRRTWLQSRLLA